MKAASSIKGQSILELIVAMGVFVMASSAAFILFFGGQSTAVDSANARLGLDYASEGLEAVRLIRNNDWALLTAGDHGVVYNGSQWEVSSSTTNTKDIFTRRLTISDVATDTKKIIATVTWQTDPQRPQTIQLTEQLTNWKNAITGSCETGTVSGNWANPQIIGSADIGAGNTGRDVAIKLPYVFVAGTASTANKPDLFVFNVATPTAPTLIKSIDIGSGGINALAIKDNYLYAASSNDNKEFIVFDVSNPPATAEVASLNLSGSANAIGITVFASTTAIGRDSAATNELAFIDISTPTSPVVISQVATGGSIYDFYSTDRRLYFVSQQSDPDIWVYDITDPEDPLFVTNYDIPGTTEDVSLYLQERDGTNILDGNIQDELIVIGATSTPFYIRDRINVGGDVNDITCIESGYAFLATSNPGKEFLMVDVSHPDSIAEWGYLNLPQIAEAIKFYDNKVYLVMRSNDAFRIIGPGP